MRAATREIIRRFYDEIDAALGYEACITAIDDGRRFMATWGDVYEGLGWTLGDVFGSYNDGTGLIGRLRGRRVIAMTTHTAAIRNPSGTIATYRKELQVSDRAIKRIPLDDLIA